jgi:predicted RNase H-related nuclease YkuK (DUF458 family)
MISPTYGNITFQQLVDIIANYIQRNGTDHLYELAIGTDSQNFADTKVVLAITLMNPGNGGIFFYQVQRIRKINNVREKITFETTQSLACAQTLLDEAEKYAVRTGFNIQDHIHFVIHVDAGPNGKSRETIDGICGWVKACGYDVVTKPRSYATSSVANKISK